MQVSRLQLTVKPENKAAVEKKILTIGTLAQVLGWGMLAEMAARRVSPFETWKIKGNFRQRKKKARKELIRWAMNELKAAGLEVKNNGQAKA